MLFAHDFSPDQNHKSYTIVGSQFPWRFVQLLHIMSTQIDLSKLQSPLTNSCFMTITRTFPTSIDLKVSTLMVVGLEIHLDQASMARNVLFSLAL